MNITKTQQRVLHMLARGGKIQHHRDLHGRVVHVDCLTREGFRLEACDLGLFAKLKARRLIASHGGGPYRISREGLLTVRAQANNR